MAQKKCFKLSQKNKLVLDEYIAYRISLKKANETIDNDKFALEKFG